MDLLNHLWQLTLGGVVVLLLLAAVGGLPARVRRFLAGLAWVKFVLPVACLAAPVVASDIPVGKSNPKYAACVAIKRDGTIALNGRVASRDDLATAFMQLGRDDADRPLLIEMAWPMPYKYFGLVTDLARKSGLKRYDLQAGVGKPAAEQEIGPRVFGLSELDEIPRATSQASPGYPMMERRIGKGDTVVVEFIVDVEGLVRNVAALPTRGSLDDREDPGHLQRDLMHFEFGLAAEKAVAHWKFTPGRKDGVPVPTRMRAPISFIPRP